MSDCDPLDLFSEYRDGSVRIHASGELDMATVPLLDEAFAAAERLRPTCVLLDFSKLTFMDSSGLESLLHAHDRARQSGGMIGVLKCSEPVWRVFEVTGMDHVFEWRSDPNLPAPGPLNGDGARGAIPIPGEAPDG